MKPNKLAILFLAAFVSSFVHGQLFKPLGLGIETPRDMVGNWYLPQMHVEGDILYVCTKEGLYSKDLSEEGSAWQLVGFEGVPLQDYVRRGEDMLALRHCYYVHSEFLLLSHNGGTTYEDITPAFFKGKGYAFLRIEQHPTDLGTLLTSSSSDRGMYLTTDFGQTWNKLADYTPEYTGFHPLIPDIIYESGGEHLDEISDLHISYDGGHTWQNRSSQLPHYLEIFRMAFHPTEPNKWIAGGYHCIHSTNDNGQTWVTQHLRDYENPLNLDYMSPWRYAAYDNENPDIIYMAGSSYNGYMKLMCSTDGGQTWNRPYMEPIKTSPTEFVFDMKQYADKLLIYSQSDVYEVSKEELIKRTTPADPVAFTEGQMATIVLPTEPEASKGKYYRLDRVEGNEIVFEQEMQPKAHIPYIIVPSEDFCIEIGTLDLNGLSRDTVSIDGVSFIGTYQKEEIESKEGFYIDIIDATPDCILSGSRLKVGALRAFLQVHWAYIHGGTIAPAEKMQIVLHDHGTGLKTLSNSPLKGEIIYDLNGRIVNGKWSNGKLPHGIYIKDGRKTFKK